MSDDIWDDPALTVSDSFYKFEAVGDQASGVILTKGRKEWPDGKVDAELLLKDDADGEEKTLTVGTLRMKEKFVELRPGPGDHVFVKLTSIEPRPGGKSMKHYEIVVNGGGAPVAQAAPVAEPVAAAPAHDGSGAVTDAALANLGLTSEQLASLRALQPQG